MPAEAAGAPPSHALRTYADDMGLEGLGQAVVVVGAVSVLLLVSVTAVMVTMTVRGVRRVRRSLRAGLAAPPLATHQAAAVGAGTTLLASPGWWGVQRRRRAMWRAVSAAQQAVETARREGAPVGDLPGLAGQLRSAAVGVDRLLRASAGARSLTRDADVERARIEAAAHDVHRAAVDALRLVASVDTEPVLSAVRLEVAALAAGVRAAGLRRPS